MRSLLSAESRSSGTSVSSALYNIVEWYALFTAKFPKAALAARWTSVSWLLRRKRMGSRVSRPTGRTSFSVISAKARAALRCKSTLSEKDRVVNAESGAPWKKLVVVRSGKLQLAEQDLETLTSCAYSQEIGEGLLQPLARSPTTEARTIVICGSELDENVSWAGSRFRFTKARVDENLQHDSQQLETAPMVVLYLCR